MLFLRPGSWDLSSLLNLLLENWRGSQSCETLGGQIEKTEVKVPDRIYRRGEGGEGRVRKQIRDQRVLCLFCACIQRIRCIPLHNFFDTTTFKERS